MFFMFLRSENPLSTDISTELPSLGDLENPGQLLVQGWFKGTDDCILWIFTISSLFIFSRSRNPLLTFLMSYHVWVTSKIHVNFRFERYWWFCLKNFWNFHTIHVFEVRESIADISTELPCLGDLEKIQIHFRFNRYSEVLVIGSCRFLKFLHYLCFLRSGNPLLIFLLSYHVWGTSKIQFNFRFKRFSRLPKHSVVD